MKQGVIIFSSVSSGEAVFCARNPIESEYANDDSGCENGHPVSGDWEGGEAAGWPRFRRRGWRGERSPGSEFLGAGAGALATAGRGAHSEISWIRKESFPSEVKAAK